MRRILLTAAALAFALPAYAFQGRGAQNDNICGCSISVNDVDVQSPPHRSNYLEFSDDGRTVVGYWNGPGDTYLGADPYTAQARYQEQLQAKAAKQRVKERLEHKAKKEAAKAKGRRAADKRKAERAKAERKTAGKKR
jgi:hypothetical protein